MSNENIETKEVPVIDMGTLYDLNKNLVKQNEIELTEAVLNSKKEIVKNFITKSSNHYYMLLCNEQKDYTVFNWKDTNDIEGAMEISKILIDECLKNRGEIRGIDITQDKGAIEIWLLIDEEAYVYYFFPYDSAIIEV